MSTRAPTLDSRLCARRCVACGYDGELLRGGSAARCAHCGCDLQERPARSYAEMEGLVGCGATVEAGGEPEAARPAAERWLAFCILVGACLIAIGYLVAAMTL